MEVEDYLRHSPGIVMPIGSTEQHGPNGLLGTDAMCPEIIAHRAGEQSGLLVGPTLSLGIAQHHMAFAGSMCLRPSTLIAVLYDAVDSLRRHGFTRIYFLNGHGGNIATVNAAFAQIYGRYSMAAEPCPFALKRRDWWELPDVTERLKDMYPVGHGTHASISEVAVTQYAYPEFIKLVKMDPEIAPTGPVRDAADYRGRFPDGRIGSNPALATPEDGEKIVELCAEALVKDFEAFVQEE
jgi:creatinine amidohydrolase/Fe(II)-dependent formamide hydrolase-like protein